MKRPSGFDNLPERPRDERQGAKDNFLAQNAARERQAVQAAEETITAAAVVSSADVEETTGSVGVAGAVGDASEVGSVPEHGTLDTSETRDLSDTRTGALVAVRETREADPVRAAARRVRDARRERKAHERRERRRFSADARRRRRTWLVAAGTVVALAIFVCVGVFTPVMAVRDVQVEGVTTIDAAELTAALKQFEGTPLALVHDADVRDALEPFSRVQQYTTELIPPHTLVIRIEERVPVVTIARGGVFDTYDAAGVLLTSSEVAPAGIPIAAGSVARTNTEAFTSAARALRDMSDEMRAQIASVTATSAQDVEFVLASGLEVMWGNAENTKRKTAVLSQMLASLGERPVTYVDVSSSEAPVYR